MIKAGLASLAGVGAGMAVPRLWRYMDRPRAGKNIVFIVVDTLRADHLGCYGYGRDTSPNIDDLAGKATVYLRNKSQSTLTTSSMASMFTSQLLLSHFVPEVLATLPGLLSWAGYRTIGIQTNPWLDEKRGFTRGFDRYERVLPARVAEQLVDWHLKDAEVNGFYCDAETVFEKTREVIGAQRQGEPFFLYIHFMDVHGPYVPKDDYDLWSGENRTFAEKLRLSGDFITPGADRPLRIAALRESVEALYDGEIREADHAIGNIITLLADQGLYDDTCIVVASDHGEHFGEHGLVQHANSVYEELLATPLIVKAAGQTAKEEKKFLTSNVDIARTILSHGGFRERHLSGLGVRGRVLETVRNEDEEICRAALVAHQFKDGFYSVEKEGMKLIVETRILDDDTQTEDSMLFNLWKDPREETNLGKSDAAMAAALMPELRGYKKGRPVEREIERAVSPEEEAQLKALGYL